MGEFKDKTEGVADRAGGKVEEDLGKAFGNDYTEAKGDAMQVEGDLDSAEGDLEGDIRRDEKADRDDD